MFQQEGQDEKDDKCWEVWWKGQISHIRTLRGRFWEIALSLRFFMVQYGVAYSLNVAGHDKSFRVSSLPSALISTLLRTMSAFEDIC